MRHKYSGYHKKGMVYWRFYEKILSFIVAFNFLAHYIVVMNYLRHIDYNLIWFGLALSQMYTELLDKFKVAIKEAMPHLKEEKIANKVRHFY